MVVEVSRPNRLPETAAPRVAYHKLTSCNFGLHVNPP